VRDIMYGKYVVSERRKTTRQPTKRKNARLVYTREEVKLRVGTVIRVTYKASVEFSRPALTSCASLFIISST
jgi:hypothetical protein